MKFFKLACLSGLLWLTGCASTGMVPDAIHGPALANARSGHPATEAAYSPLTPSGQLQPITAAQATSRAVTELAPPADIWERIRRGYGMPNLESELVLDREQWYSSRPDYILRMTERSNKYLFHIVEELERRNMPSELALLPFIESAFNPQAISSAKAAGMWQFMPATGKHFDLKQNAFRDDRRDVLASTRAALDYLQKLYGMFGDWDLALAAYNWGEGSVGRAIAKNKRAGLGLAYTDLTMPAETRLYVPKLQAVKNIVSNPQAFNTRLPLIGNHPYFQTVDIKHDIDVALVAKLAEVTVDDFKALNPSGGSRPVILAAGTPQILLPWDNAVIFQSNLKDFNGGRLASWTVWRAPSTMNPAEAAKRVGMTEAELRSVNKIPPRMVIRAGSSLLVPRPSQLDTDVAVTVADNGQVSFSPEVILKRTLIRAGKKDSVAKMASRYRVSAASVAEWNNVSAAAVFKTGQKVVMFLPVRAKTLVQQKTASKKQPVSKQARSKVSKPTRLAKRP